MTKEDVTTRESYSELSLGGTLMVCMRREVPHSRRSSSGRGRGLPPRRGQGRGAPGGGESEGAEGLSNVAQQPDGECIGL